MSLIGLVGAFVDSMGGLHEPLKEADPEDSIQVCVRIRPILKDERGDSSAWTWGENVIKSHNSIHLPYTFDHLFFPENSNNDIFNSVVRNVVLRSMQGVHGSVFTYGQTSSGKTFTMNGSQAQPGIIPQSIFYCFESIQNEFTDREFLFRVSYIEVYNEQVKDLLSTEPTQIKIQYDPKLGTQLSGVKEEVVVSPHQVIALLKAGEAHRHVGSTDMNEKSSRAHTLFKLIIESKLKGDAADTPVRVSNLNLVDLAGSENAKMTNSVGERAREAKHINQSLLTLSLIIQRLSEEKPGSAKRQYLPYRDSKLTRLLQASLSGNAHIAVICTVSSTQRCVEETHNTLKFAARAKKIKTNAMVNEMMDDKTLLRAYKMEIFNLKARLVAMEDKPKLDRDSQAIFIDGSEGDELETNDFDERREEGEEIVHEMIRHLERLILTAPSNAIIKSLISPKNSPKNRSSFSNSNQSSLDYLNNLSASPFASAFASTDKDDTTTGIAINSKVSTTTNSISIQSPPRDPLKGPARRSGLKPPSHFSTSTVIVDLIPEPQDEGEGNQDDVHSPSIASNIQRIDSKADSEFGSLDEELNGGAFEPLIDDTWRNIQTAHSSFISNLEGEVIATGLTSLKIPEKSRSSSSIGKAYLKSIESPTSSRIDIPALNPREKNTAVGRLSTSASRKFGFVPSAALTKSLSRVEKDSRKDSKDSKDNEITIDTVKNSNSSHKIALNDKNNGAERGYFSLSPSPDQSESDLDGDRFFDVDSHKKMEDVDTDGTISLEDSRATTVANFFVEHVDIPNLNDTQGSSSCVKNVNNGDKDEGKEAKDPEIGDQMLFGVSQMLAMLKKHVEKSSAIKRRLTPLRKGAAVSSSSLPDMFSSPPPTVDDRRISYTSSMAGIGMRDINHSLEFPSFKSVNSPLPLHPPSENTAIHAYTPGGRVTEHEKYLLEEIEKKDNVLAMLTQGLREVENFQAGYMQSLNIDLALAKAHNEDLIGQVEDLSSATTELKNALDDREMALGIRERQLVFISGVLPSYDEF